MKVWLSGLLEPHNANLLRMIRVGMVWLLTGMMLRAGWGQQDIRPLEQTLEGRPMALRSYSADSVASYVLAGGTLVPGPIRLHTLGVFTTRSVKVKRDKIVIEGERETLVRDVDKNQVEPIDEAPMRLEVDLHGADSATVLSRLKEMLFFLIRSLRSRGCRSRWQRHCRSILGGCRLQSAVASTSTIAATGFGWILRS